jgi:EmrB/QacA subfamily drug resistance transporter
MIFAVAMTFIDQTIVTIAVPELQRELRLTNTGVQWAVNAYLLSLAALFAFGGRLADTVGHRFVLVIGVVVFTAASLLCGLTPKGAAAQSWIIAFRLLQGAGGALLFPAALAIVVQTFPLRQRGRALAAFFGIAGGLTALGPIIGGYLSEWTWRSVFWVNVPVAIIALALIARARPTTAHRRAPMDYRGAALIAVGIGLSVLGFQQSTVWGWRNPVVALCIAGGVLVLVYFYAVERRTASPLIRVGIFRVRPFLVENLVLFVAMLAFVPVFFFTSLYAQIALAKSASQAGLYLLYFFIGFVIAAQLGGRMLDATGAKLPVVLGCVVAAVGFLLWAGQVTGLDFSTQAWWVALTGAGMGCMLGPASTDAVSRASRLSYGEATGITQTVRNYAASLGLAVLGTILVMVTRSHVRSSLLGQGVSRATANRIASQTSQFQGTHGDTATIPAFIRLDFADAIRVVLYVMAGIMGVAALIAFIGLRAGRQTAEPENTFHGRPRDDTGASPTVDRAGPDDHVRPEEGQQESGDREAMRRREDER